MPEQKIDMWCIISGITVIRMCLYLTNNFRYPIIRENYERTRTKIIRRIAQSTQ